MKAQVERPSELDTSFLNEDGFKRNLAKMKAEWYWAKKKAAQSPAGHGWIFTAAMNNLVERLRHAPYTFGHYIFYGVVLAVVIGVVL